MTAIYEQRKPIGDKGENEFSRYINKFEDWEVIYMAPSNLNFPFYDVVILNKLTGQIKRIEVKTDTYNNTRTAIEFRQNGLPSGIETTQADVYFIYKIGLKEIYSIEVNRLKKLILDIGFPVEKCNGKTSDCYMVDLSHFKRLVSSN